MRQPFLSARRQRGLTLIELMVSLVIGLAVIGALLAAYMVSFRSSAHNDAMVQVTEDATMALSIMRAQASMAGYSQIDHINFAGQTLVGRDFASAPVFGCAASNFGTTQSIRSPAACTGTGSDSLEVAYEVNDGAWGGGSSNAILSGGIPVDCLGNALNIAPLGYYLADSKFYVKQDGSGNYQLFCQQGTASAAPLVDNVETLSVKYGIGNGSSQIVKYAPANTADWTRVMSISICVVVRSAVPVFDKTVGTAKNALDTYVDCSGNTAHSTDGRLRRSFSTTVLLQNRIL